MELRDITQIGNYQNKLSKMLIAFKSYRPPKNNTTTVENEGCSGLKHEIFS
jgi:hypothetical protein